MRLFENPTGEASTLPRHLAEVVAALPQHLIHLVNALPPWLIAVIASAPVYVDRKTGADLVSHYITPVSHRSLEAWPLPWQRVNGRAITLLIVIFAVAYAKLAAAPVIMGGRRVTRNAHPNSRPPDKPPDVQTPGKLGTGISGALERWLLGSTTESCIPQPGPCWQRPHRDLRSQRATEHLCRCEFIAPNRLFGRRALDPAGVVAISADRFPRRLSTIGPRE